MTMTPSQIAAIFGCTEDQARAQLEANAKQLREMEGRAAATGRKYRGYTADQLAKQAAAFEAAAK